MSAVHLRLLGGFTLTVDGETAPRDGWGRRSASALVKLLALAPGQRLHREQVVDALWPELPLERAAPRLHKAAFYARQAVRDAVVLRGETVALFPNDEVVVDVDEFERLARTAVSTRDDDALARALNMRGLLLPDDRYEPWVAQRAESIRLRHLELLHVARRWNDLLDLDPADEVAHLALTRQHMEAGNRHAALRQLERLEYALRELGLPLNDDATELRVQLTSHERASVKSPHRPPGSRHPRHRFEHRRLAAFARCGTTTRTPVPASASCASCSPCA